MKTVRNSITAFNLITCPYSFVNSLCLRRPGGSFRENRPLDHIMIASSDGYFLNTIYNDSKLKKCSKFYKVDYLPKGDVIEWLLNLEKYSRIKNYTLSREDAEKIWDVVGGSMWEIQDILTELFEHPIDDVLAAILILPRLCITPRVKVTSGEYACILSNSLFCYLEGLEFRV